MKDLWLVAIGAGRWQKRGIAAAKEAGLKVLAVDEDSTAPGCAIADRSLKVDIRNEAKVIEALENTGIQPSGAIAFCNEAGMLTVAAIREKFNLPGIRTRVATSLTNKGLQRASWQKAGLPCPLWFVVRGKNEVPEVLSRIGAKAIFKPVDSAGSRGISVVNQNEPWEEAFKKAFQASRSGQIIIEAFITGIEHTIETFTHRGETWVLAITSKKKVAGTSDTVAGELASAVLGDEIRQNAERTVINSLAALDFTDGPGHTEFILTVDNRIFLVEAAGRGGGFMVADGIVPAVSGFALSRACALQAVGVEPELPKLSSSKFAVLRFIPSRLGTVRNLQGFGPENELPSVLCEPMVQVGQVMSAASSDVDRMAFILSYADSLEAAYALADYRQSQLTINID